MTSGTIAQKTTLYPPIPDIAYFFQNATGPQLTPKPDIWPGTSYRIVVGEWERKHYLNHYPEDDFTQDSYIEKRDGQQTVDTQSLEKAAQLRIAYRNPEVVISYLTSHPEIKDFLLKAQSALIRCFGDSVTIILEVITFPEEECEKLVGWIQSTDSVDEGLEKLDQFDEEWFLDHSHEIDNKFSFNIETL